MKYYLWFFSLLIISCQETDIPEIDSEIEEYLALNSDTKKLVYKVKIKPKYGGSSKLKIRLESKNIFLQQAKIKTEKNNNLSFYSDLILSDSKNDHFYFEIHNLSDNIINALENNQVKIVSLSKNFTFDYQKEFTLSYIKNEEEFSIQESSLKGKVLSSMGYDSKNKILEDPILKTPLPLSEFSNSIFSSLLPSKKDLTILALDKNKAQIVMDKVDEYGYFGVKNEIVQFEPIYDSKLLGYVAPVNNYEKWVFGLNYMNVFERTNLITKDNLKSNKTYIHTIIHELAHIFTLQKSNINDNFPCNTDKVLNKCINENSLIGQFYTKFWKDKEYQSIKLGEVVTLYGQTNMAEDIAETIVYYLRLKELPLDETKYNQLRHKKIRFLHTNAKLKEIRDSKVLPIDENLSVEPNNKTGEIEDTDPLALKRKITYKSCLHPN